MNTRHRKSRIWITDPDDAIDSGGRYGINEAKRIKWIFFSLFLLITVSAIGYWLMLGITFTDALYMTIITISTVGYKEVVDMTPTAKVFSIFVIFGGIGIVGYTFTSLEIIILESNKSD